MKLFLGALVVFTGGVYAGLKVVAAAAQQAGCPAASSVKKKKETKETGAKRTAPPGVEDFISSLASVRQRSARRKPGSAT